MTRKQWGIRERGRLENKGNVINKQTKSRSSGKEVGKMQKRLETVAPKVKGGKKQRYERIRRLVNKYIGQIVMI